MVRRRLTLGLAAAIGAASLSLVTPSNRLLAQAAQPNLPAGLNFGLGNEPGDLGWMTSSGVPWRYRYTYLSAGVNTGNGWETWNAPAGQYATYYMDASAANGYLPVFSYYELLQSNPSIGSDESSRDFSNLNNAATMNAYYANFALLMQKAQAFGRPVIVQIEPDLWGYLEQRAGSAGPQSLSAMVTGSGNPDVSGIPDTAQGFAWALLHLRDRYAPNALLAIHASLWATSIDLATDPDPSVSALQVADNTAAFLNAAGLAGNPYGSTFDLIFNDVADHDAGSYGDNSHWWDKNNIALPNFARWLSFMARLRADTGRPLIVWQVPVGNQYFLTMNNTPGHYQDNHAEYFLAHPDQIAAAGIQAVLFGKANAGQTNYTDDLGDGITNNGGAATSGYQCTGCNSHPSTVADDDGGFLRMAVGQYYRCQPSPSSTTGTAPTGATASFYFAEGYTGTGFHETLSLFAPNAGGTATIDYYTRSGHQPTVFVPLLAGRVTIEDVNTDVGCDQEVSAKVTLPGSGVVERTLHFNRGAWYGSTDQVGVSQPSSEWDFAEGSTLSAFSEYLTIQNPGAAAVNVSLNYFLQNGAHPVKQLSLAANSRTTIEVFSGDLGSQNPCSAGTGGNCGVGPGQVGVSVQLRAAAPIVAERPMYVNGFSFGAGPIRDGHAAFGATAPARQWDFAEGTTLKGFEQYLTLENPATTAANVELRYLDPVGTVTTRALSVAAHSRATVLVNDTQLGVGPGVVGVSTRVSSDQAIVAERPMYMVHDFGAGPVAGAHDVVGATGLSPLFGFAAASTATGEADYLTIENPASVASQVTLTYYPGGAPVVRQLTIPPTSRHTVALFQAAEGIGPGVPSLGIVISADQPLLVEKPTYSANPASYGATDTAGFPASAF